MLNHTLARVWQAERAAAEGGLLPALQHLRRLGLPEFADVLLAMPAAEFPALSAVLPRMPDDAVQEQFDGAAGKPVMQDGVSFVRVVAGAFRDLTHRDIRGGRILDVGCGWGRLLRLMAFYADPSSLQGLDPRPEAVALCAHLGVPGHTGLSNSAALAASAAPFDVIYAYSVLTHLPLASMDTAMAGFRAAIAANGLLAVTVRPIEFWTFLAQRGDQTATLLHARHLQDGFAFRPHGSEEAGDLSVDHAWFTARYPQWELRGTDRGWDELQTVLLLTPR